METIDWIVETPKIEEASKAKNVDPAFVKAIRECEHGRSGTGDVEFGVLSARGQGYDVQLQMCVATVAHQLAAYTGNPLHRDSFGRICYTATWVAYFQSIWAPVGVDNDPTGLNKNWLNNVLTSYTKWIDGKI